ncbi:MAG: porin family protein [Dysgonomonas sp.]|nr:porin family protein [Dysgonomonas sp.]
MKKTAVLLSCIFMLFISLDVSAQIPFTWGVKSGVSLSNTSTDEYDMKVGFTGGVFVDYNFSRSVFLRSGLDFTMKGAKLDAYGEELSSSVPVTYNYVEKIRMNYLQIPLMIGYKYRVADGTNIYIAAGTYFAYGIYGKGKYSISSVNNSGAPVIRTESKHDGFDDMELKKFDFGLSGNIGVIYDRYSINVGYEHGLVNLQKDITNRDLMAFRQDRWRNLAATCTVGYRF